MPKYIGLKEVNAILMTRGDYNQLRGWQVPAEENPSDLGYLVEYLDGGKPNHPDFDGYISWSPEGVFNRAYRPQKGLTFGTAIEALRRSCRAARAGWNGKGMFILYVPQQLLGAGLLVMRDYIAMMTADGQFVPWVASQTDMLANDWMLLDEMAMPETTRVEDAEGSGSHD